MDIPKELIEKNRRWLYKDEKQYPFYDTESFQSSTLFMKYVDKVSSSLQEFYLQKVQPQVHFLDTQRLVDFFKLAIYIEEVHKYTEMFDEEVPYTEFFRTNSTNKTIEEPLNSSGGVSIEKMRIFKSMFKTAYSPFWQNEMYSRTSCDGEELTLEGTENCRDFASDIEKLIKEVLFADNGRLSHLYNLSIYSACLQRVREKTIESGYTVNQENFFRKTLPKTDFEKWALINRIADLMMCGAENILAGIRMRYYNDNDFIRTAHDEMEKVKLRNDRLKEEVEILNKKNERLETELNNIRYSRDQVAIRKSKEFAEDLCAMEKQNKQLQKQCEELLTDKNRLLEYIEMQEASDTAEEETENPDILHSDEFACIADGRIIFVRDKEKDTYPVMGKLAKVFPNAVFTNLAETSPDFSKADIVVLLTKYTKHGLYWEARDRAKLAGAMCVHSDKSRVESVVNDILRFINGDGGYKMGRSA